MAPRLPSLSALHLSSLLRRRPRLPPLAVAADADVRRPWTAAASDAAKMSEYKEVLARLSSLITARVRGDGANRGDKFDLMQRYVEILDLKGPISDMKVIHVAGTKGKGSTCVFTESILRSHGFRTGLFTSPHLIDVRERFRLDGVDISEEKFLKYFSWCWDKLKEKTDDDEVPMPTYFRFLALLAFKIFSAEQVDVTLLEVGLGGKYDATNVVETPVVCGIASLGYDHMEILGNTLGQIAGEKAGIFKKGIPAYTVPQPEEAMSVLEDRAAQLAVPLQVVHPLDAGSVKGQHLSLHGEHQYVNAGLAVALASSWLKRMGHIDMMPADHANPLPELFIKGLTSATLQGRAQVVQDSHIHYENGKSNLVFYLDGAHSPESMQVCGSWFSHIIKDGVTQKCSSEDNGNVGCSRQILVFNCMSVRDPQLLLPSLVAECAKKGVHFHKALFVPSQSQYHKLGSHTAPPPEPQKIDLSWQFSLQRVWEKLPHGDEGINCVTSGDSEVLESLPLAMKWLRERAQQDESCSYQVLVTGSLHLVGDVLRILKK